MNESILQYIFFHDYESIIMIQLTFQANHSKGTVHQCHVIKR